MNLKESFRYQKFLDTLMANASASIVAVDHCLKTVKVHKRNAVNPDAEDMTEEVEVPAFIPNDTMILFMSYLVDEREKLSIAIGKAKASIGFDIDAAVETNKFRQSLHSSIRRMMRYAPGKSKSQARGYKFDINGVQQAYIYDVETTTSENYTKDTAKALMRNMITTADDVSARVDAALINTTVEYDPPYDVNESFEDVLETFVSNTPKAE